MIILVLFCNCKFNTIKLQCRTTLHDTGLRVSSPFCNDNVGSLTNCMASMLWQNLASLVLFHSAGTFVKARLYFKCSVFLYLYAKDSVNIPNTDSGSIPVIIHAKVRQ